MGSRMQTWVGSLALALAVGGCSAILDTEKKQCKKDTDCGVKDGKALYTCEKNFCTATACTTDAECQMLEGYICEQQVCAPPLCTGDEQCAMGLACQSGRCDDPILGCYDSTPPTWSEEPAVLILPVFQFFGDLPVRDLSVTVCDRLDVNCANPLPTPPIEHEYVGTELTIRGLTNGQRYIVRLSGKDDKGEDLFPTDFIMARPVVGTTREVNSVELTPSFRPSFLAGTAGDVQYDPKSAIFVAQVFGCDGKPLAGVSALDSRGSGTLFYLTGQGADANLTETDETGQVGFINLDTAPDGNPYTHKITFSYKGQPLYAFSVLPRPGVLNFMLMPMADYKTTERLRPPQ